jgi:co-chaperonin GroES (HSP10)
MKPIRFFIVKVPKATNDTIEIAGQQMYLDTRFNEFAHRAHEGEVVGVPELYKTGVKTGDTLYFHHHVVIGGNHMVYGNQQLKDTNLRRGQFVYGNEDLYYVRWDGGYDPHSCQAYAYKCKDTQEIRLLGDWIFLTPAPQEDELKSDVLEILQQKKPYNQYGYIKYPSAKLEELGLHPGDKVFIQKNADYSMEVDGEMLYRVLLVHIYAQVQEQL